MKVKLGELKNSIQALNRLSAIPLSAKLSYRIMRITRDAGKELELLHSVHIELIKKHGGVESENGTINVPAERMPEFMPEFNELLQQEAELHCQPILITELFNAESWRCSACNQTMVKTDPEISANDLMMLSWLIKDPQEIESLQPPTEQSESAQGQSVN